MTRLKVCVRRGFTLVELLVVVAIIGVLVGLLIPAVQAALEASRRSRCVNNVKQLCLGLANFESIKGQLPQAGTRPWDVHGGASWIVMVLPFVEEQEMYDTLSGTTSGFTQAFAPAADDLSDPLFVLALRRPKPVLCPSYGGTLDQGRPPWYSANDRRVTITNYKGNASAENGFLVPSYNAATHKLGGPLAVTYTGSNFGQSAAPFFGVPYKMILDGLSNTIIVAESKEPDRSSWIGGYQNEGQSWLTATNAACTNSNGVTTTSGTLAIRDSLTDTGSMTYNGVPGKFGVSSDHPNGVAIHGYVDGHVVAVTADVDPNPYLAAFSRAGGEASGDKP